MLKGCEIRHVFLRVCWPVSRAPALAASEVPVLSVQADSRYRHRLWPIQPRLVRDHAAPRIPMVQPLRCVEQGSGSVVLKNENVLIRPVGAFPRRTGLVRLDLVVCALRLGHAGAHLRDQCCCRSATHLRGSFPDRGQEASDVRAVTRVEPIWTNTTACRAKRLLERWRELWHRHLVPCAWLFTLCDVSSRLTPTTRAGMSRAFTTN